MEVFSVLLRVEYAANQHDLVEGGWRWIHKRRDYSTSGEKGVLYSKDLTLGKERRKAVQYSDS